MDDPLNNAPALALVKDLSTWFIVNNRGEPILWIDGQKELTWFFARILECTANEQKRLVVKKASTKAQPKRPAEERSGIAESDSNRDHRFFPFQL